MPSTEHANSHRSALVSAIRAGMEAVRAGDKRKAHSLFSYVVKNDPSNEAAWLWFANTAESPRDAVHGIRTALRLNPSNASALESLPPALVCAGVAAARAGERPAASELLAEATVRDPNNETAWLWRAGVTDDPGEAVEHLERVLRINPNNEHAKKGLARLKAQAEGPAAAACPLCGHQSRDRDTVAETCPGCGAVRVLYRPERFARSLEHLNVPVVEAAVRRLRAAWAAAPTAQTAFALGLAYLNLGQTEPGLAALQTAAQAPGANPEWRDEVTALAQHLRGDAVAVKPASRLAPPAPRVMIVDDSPTVRKLVNTILTRAGYAVLEAGSAEEAVAAVRRADRPKLFVLDINMPGTDGFGLCKLLRAERETADVPVVFLTGKTGLLSKLHGRWAGAADYLTKPFEPEKLLAVVARLVPLPARKP